MQKEIPRRQKKEILHGNKTTEIGNKYCKRRGERNSMKRQQKEVRN